MVTIDRAMALINKMVKRLRGGNKFKARRGKKIIKRNAYRERNGHAFRKNRPADEKVGRLCLREGCYEGHRLGHGLTHDV